MKRKKKRERSSFPILVEGQMEYSRVYDIPVESIEHSISLLRSSLDELQEEVRNRKDLWQEYPILKALVDIAVIAQASAEDLGLLRRRR